MNPIQIPKKMVLFTRNQEVLYSLLPSFHSRGAPFVVSVAVSQLSLLIENFFGNFYINNKIYEYFLLFERKINIHRPIIFLRRILIPHNKTLIFFYFSGGEFLSNIKAKFKAMVKVNNAAATRPDSSFTSPAESSDDDSSEGNHAAFWFWGRTKLLISCPSLGPLYDKQTWDPWFNF